MGTTPQPEPADATPMVDADMIPTNRGHFRYPQQVTDTDLLVPKVELTATASAEQLTRNDSEYTAYLQRYRDAIQPPRPSRPRHATALQRARGTKRAG